LATLVPIAGIAGPPYKSTKSAAGARAAEKLGMKQLATRLEKLASVTG